MVEIHEQHVVAPLQGWMIYVTFFQGFALR